MLLYYIKTKMSRYYAFTLDNYTNENGTKNLIFCQKIKEWCIYFKVMKNLQVQETPHLQCCFCLKKRAKLLTIKNIINIKELHLEQWKKKFTRLI